MVLSARAIGRSYWAFAYPLWVLVVGSILSWQAIFFLPILPWLMWSVLIGLAVWGWRRAPVSWSAIKPTHWSEWIVVAVLFTELLYAAFPAYRYDQWNYHLIIPHIVARDGPLPHKVLYDHLYFAGVFEYIPTLIRVGIDDPWINHTASDALSWLAFAIGIYGLCRWAVKRWNIACPCWLLAGFLIYATPEHEAIFNLKPDAQLWVFTFAFVLLFLDQREQPQKSKLFGLGLLLVAPLAYKVTWLHVGLPLGLLLLIEMFRRRYAWRVLITGAAVGLVWVMPHWYKNVIYLGNPLHPTQIGPFHSDYWGAEFDAYWNSVHFKAHNWREYFQIFGRNLLHFPQRVGWFWLPFAGLLVWEKQYAARLRGHWYPWLAVLGVMLLIWPWLYYEQIFNRFVFPVFAIFGAIILLGLRDVKQTPRAMVVILLLPVLFASSFEVRWQRMLRRCSQSIVDYAASQGVPLSHYVGDQQINQHRSQHFPQADFQSAVVLSDSAMGFFLDGQRMDFPGPDFQYRWGQARCLATLVQQQDIRYVRTYLWEFANWPTALQPLIALSKPVSDDPRVRWLDDNARQLLATDPAYCLPFADLK